LEKEEEEKVGFHKKKRIKNSPHPLFGRAKIGFNKAKGSI
jgi:hypothetical protein